MANDRIPRRASLYEVEGEWNDRLREAIKRSNRKKMDIAHELSMDYNTLTLYEYGRSPRMDRLAELCRALNVSADDILGL